MVPVRALPPNTKLASVASRLTIARAGTCVGSAQVMSRRPRADAAYAIEYRIHYHGWSKKFDEWVRSDSGRIKYSRSPVQALQLEDSGSRGAERIGRSPPVSFPRPSFAR